MKFAVKNLKNSSHSICRLNGEHFVIKPNGFVIFDVEEEREINFWMNTSKSNASKYGLEIITDSSSIYELESGVFNNSSIVDDFISPIAREIADSTKASKPDTGYEDTNTDREFTEENLLKLAKEDLFNICDNFNIKYKKNNSVKTLVKLLVENGVVSK